jgi:hypothetical protein
MTDSELRERAEGYIDGAVAESGGDVTPEAREAAIERVEAASRELLAAQRERDRESAAC